MLPSKGILHLRTMIMIPVILHYFALFCCCEESRPYVLDVLYARWKAVPFFLWCLLGGSSIIVCLSEHKSMMIEK